MTDQELDSLIGKKLEAFKDNDASGSDNLIEFTVKAWKRTGDTFMLLSEDNEMYSEDEINWRYSITPEAALWVCLMDAGIIPDDFTGFDFDKYHAAFEMFMSKLEMLEIIAHVDDNGDDTDDDCECESTGDDGSPECKTEVSRLWEDDEDDDEDEEDDCISENPGWR